MQELIAKIEELKKALTSFKPKSQQNSLVPALAPPSVKPLSMPARAGNKPAKLPGVSQPSGKDPKAMAAQLKNPRPKKPKIEILKTDRNGQWSLEKMDEMGNSENKGKAGVGFNI